MKVLRVIPTMNPKSGGPCQGIRNITPALQLIGITTEVVCFDSDDSSYPASDEFIIHSIGPSQGPYSYCKALQPWLIKNLPRFDLVVIHGLWLYNSFGTYWAWRTLKNKSEFTPKLFLMPHGMLDPYFQKAKERKFKAFRNWIFWHVFEHKVVNNVDGLLFTCQQEMNLAKMTFSNYKPIREINIGYGVPEPPSKADLLSHADKNLIPLPKRYFLFLSRIHQKKGVDLLIEAYLKLYSEELNIPDLVIAGPGSESDFGSKLKDLASDCNKIHFIGMLSGNIKWQTFYNAEAFVLPSHQENFGIAVVEALSCGIPVLISDQVNIFKEIQDSKAGIVSTSTREGAYTLIKSWVNLSSIEKESMAENARECYINYFSIENSSMKFKEELESSVESSI